MSRPKPFAVAVRGGGESIEIRKEVEEGEDTLQQRRRKQEVLRKLTQGGTSRKRIIRRTR